MPSKIFQRASLLIFLSLPVAAKAQVVPDNTLINNSQINRAGNTFIINNGTIKGNNLFHSFQKFSIPTNIEAFFNNASNIQNIFTRVTGNSISNIDGIISANGTANLFLLNPNGIVFNSNAQINIGGSLLATTADSIIFNDGSQFNATNPTNSSLLTSSIPIGLGFGSNNSSILVNDEGHSLILTDAGRQPITRNSISPGLQVNPGKNLVLLGGEVNLKGGVLIAEGGQVELGGIKRGFVGFETERASSTWKFKYSSVSSFGNVNLANTSWIDASDIPFVTSDSFNRGIKIIGHNISIRDESVVLLQNQGSSIAGKIQIDATDSINISKAKINPIPQIPGGIISESLGSTSGDDISITAPKITILEGGAIIAKTFGPEKAGNIIIEASNYLKLLGVSADDVPPLSSTISNAAFPTGRTGSININTPSLMLQDGALITNLVYGTAVGEDIVINADNVELSGVESILGITGSAIYSSSSGASEAADIYINASNVEVKDGATISSFTYDLGKPGSININASNLVRVEGLNLQSQISSSIASTVFEVNEATLRALSLLDIELQENLTGDSGGLNIQTQKLEIIDNAIVSVQNGGLGNGGNLNIEADSIELQNQGSIEASTESGQGGNINFNANRLSLTNNSLISSTAGGAGDGGNIEITADTILGLNNSDITANAFEGDGGNIEITADTIVGLEARSLLTLQSDITADSELGIDGTVTINSPESNADEDVVVAARELNIEPYREILKGSCLDPNRPERSELFYIGGGVPESPYNFFDDDPIVATTDEASSEPKPDSKPSNSQLNNNIPPLWQEGDPLIEPNAVQTNADGRTFLVAVQEREIKEPAVCTIKTTDLDN